MDGNVGAWQRQMVQYLRRRNTSSFYWALNSNSGSVGGLFPTAEEDRVPWSTYELVAPRQLIWSMQHFVLLQRMAMLHGCRSEKGQDREHHRCKFHEELHGAQIMIRDEGMTLHSGNGPTTVLSSVSAAGEGVINWTLRYDGGNSSAEPFGRRLGDHLVEDLSKASLNC